MTLPSGPHAGKLGLSTAVGMVSASMVGTGVFTTTGFLLADLQPTTILLAWALGGIVSFAGGLAYAELGATFPESGGEYALLTRIVHPFVGFLAGFCSLTVGVAAPVAASATAFAAYGGEALGALVPGLHLPAKPVAAALVLVSAGAHALSVRLGAGFLGAVTFTQMGLCVALAAIGLALGEPGRLAATGSVAAELPTLGFAGALVTVSYAYAGWNAAVYLASELRDPARTIPAAVLGGTAFVTALYVAINAGILMAAPPSALVGQLPVAHVAASALLGPVAAAGFSGVVAFGLVANVSAFLLSGSRIAEVMGRDHPGLAFLAGRPGEGRGPARALGLLVALALGFVATSTFDQLVMFTGIVLQAFAMATVAAAAWDRLRHPDRPRPFRVPGVTIAAALFLLVSGWAIAVVVRDSAYATRASVALLAVASLAWVGSEALRRRA